MSDEPRLTGPTLKVIAALMANPLGELSGAEVAKASNLASGTLYPILLRLERAGWLQSRWEDETPQDLGRPRRRYYRVTGIGAQKARAAIKDVQKTVGGFAWA